MSGRAWTALGLVALGCGVAPALLGGQADSPDARSAYERLDETRLATLLRSLGMNELLEGLVQGSAIGAEDVEKTSVLIQAKIASAGQATTQPALHDRLLDEAMALQDKVIEATRDGKTYEEKLRHYRFSLDRAMTLGITKVAPRADRMLYLQGRPGDPEEILLLTDQALKMLDRLGMRMEETHERSGQDDEYLVSGASQKTESLMLEARYRGAWIRFYRGMVLPQDSPERPVLLKQAIANAAEFANAEDNSSGVKYLSLLLSGMAARELGDLKTARDFLQRANHPQAGELWQLRALFETAHAAIELGPPDQAENAITQFMTQGLGVLTDKRAGKVAVDMQSTLLKSHLYERRAEAIRASDPKAAEGFREQSLKVMLDFIKQYPQFSTQFVSVIAPKYEGQDPDAIPPTMLIPLGIRKYNEAMAEGLTPAEKDKILALADDYFSKALNRQGAGDDTQAEALWGLGWVRNERHKHLEAAQCFRRLAEEHPQHPHARQAPLLAVAVLQGVMKEQKKEAAEISTDFATEYVRSLEVLLARADPRDPQVPTYYYELGLTREGLGLYDQAKEALNRVPPEHELYIPARYRLLKAQVKALREDAASSADARRRQAVALVNDLNAYRRRVAEYRSDDPERSRQAQAWAAEMDLLAAELMDDPLDQSAEAIRHAREVMDRYSGEPSVRRLALEFIVRVHLKRKELDKAVELIKGIRGAEELVAQVVNQLIGRMEQLQFRTDPASVRELAEYRGVYRAFAERLYQDAVERKLDAERMYGAEQALAGAYEHGSDEEVAKALEMYERLLKANAGDSINVRGVARCYRRMGKNPEAMKRYDELVNGLPERSGDWWRAHLERLQFALEVGGGQAEELKGVLLQIRVLRFKDENLGGYGPQFNGVENRANELLKGADQKTGG